MTCASTAHHGATSTTHSTSPPPRQGSLPHMYKRNDRQPSHGRTARGRKAKGCRRATHLRGIGDGLKQKHLALARIALQGFEQRRAHLRIDKSTHSTARCTPLASAPFGQYGPVHKTHWTSSKRCVLQHRTMTWLHERTNDSSCARRLQFLSMVVQATHSGSAQARRYTRPSSSAIISPASKMT